MLATTSVSALAGGDGEPTSLAFAPSGEHVVVVVKGAGNPPESVAVIESRGLFAVGGEGNGTTAGGGIWLYEEMMKRMAANATGAK